MDDDEFEKAMRGVFEKFGMRGYILDDQHQPVETDFVTSAIWWAETKNRVIQHDSTALHEVSTITLPFDHGMHIGRRGPPRMFETMVFDNDGQPLDTIRYTSWDDAVAGHAEILKHYRELDGEPGA